MNAPDFASLMIKSDRSIGASLLNLDEITQKVKEWELVRASIGDDGLIAFFEKRGRFLPSMLAPVGKNGCPVLLLAKSQEGFENLARIASHSAKAKGLGEFLDERIVAENSRGIIAVCGGFSCEPAQIALSEKRHPEEIAAARVSSLMKLFEKGSFYLGVDHDASPEADKIAAVFKFCAKKTGCGLVAVNDARYMEGDGAAWKMLARNSGKFAGFHDFSLRSPERLFNNLKNCPSFSDEEAADLFAESVKIAKSCDFPVILPESEKNPDAAKILREKALAWLDRTGRANDPVYSARMEKELNDLGDFSEYVLVCAGLCEFLRENGVAIGPGRGSAAGSLVVHALGITEIDPVKYNLSFERFYNSWRKSPPDIDIDVPKSQNNFAIELARKFIGQSDTTFASAYGRYGASGAIRKAADLLSDNGEIAEKAECGLIPKGKSISELVDEGFFSDMPAWFGKVLNLALKLEGTIERFRTHASGTGRHQGVFKMPDNKILRDLAQICDGKSLLPYDCLEGLGFCKFDILSLAYLDIVEKTFAAIREKDKNAPKPCDIPLDDPKVFEIYANYNDMANIFQMDGFGMRKASLSLRPKSIGDLAALLALYRPATKDSQFRDYLDRKRNPKKIDYFGMPELFGPCLKDTMGIPVYQEQIMEMAMAASGMGPEAADSFRRAMKKDDSNLASALSGFEEGARKKGLPDEKIRKITDIMIKFAGYGFNRSHAVSYAVFSYRTAWLKTYYPAEYMAQTLNVRRGMMPKDREEAALIEAGRNGLLGKRSIFSSGSEYTVKDGKVIPPLPFPENHPIYSVLPGLQEKWRKHGRPSSIEELMRESPVFDERFRSEAQGFDIFEGLPKKSRMPDVVGKILDFDMHRDPDHEFGSGHIEIDGKPLRFIIPQPHFGKITSEGAFLPKQGFECGFYGKFRGGDLDVFMVSAIDNQIVPSPAAQAEQAIPADAPKSSKTATSMDISKASQAELKKIGKMLAALRGGEGLRITGDSLLAGEYGYNAGIVSRLKSMLGNPAPRA